MKVQKNTTPMPARTSTQATASQAKAAKPKKQIPNGAVINAPSSSPITPGNRASATATYSQLPADLQSVMAKSFNWPSDKWNKLPMASRKHVVAVYNRMQKHGLWKHVDKITKIIDPERKALGMRVHGNAGSVEFKAKPGTNLLTEVHKTGKYGLDSWWLSLLHRGQKVVPRGLED